MLCMQRIDPLPVLFHLPFARQLAKEWLKFHPAALTATLVFNHILRTAPMCALMIALPFSPMANAVLCTGGSLFYTITIEGNCI